ncbi:hypothetical protein GCM10027048_25420 [Hymenobacter coalescens]
MLAREEYEKAYAFTEHSLEYEDTPERWTPELIRELIYGYGLIEERKEQAEGYRVTPIATAQFRAGDASRYQEITAEEEPYDHPHRTGVIIVGEIWYALPLNGFWSDLTAAFDVLRYPDYLTLELREIHVF